MFPWPLEVWAGTITPPSQRNDGSARPFAVVYEEFRGKYPVLTAIVATFPGRNLQGNGCIVTDPLFTISFSDYLAKARDTNPFDYKS